MNNLIHKNNVGYGDCNGVLLYHGPWRYNLEMVPHKHLLVCKRCRERIVADSDELYGVIKGITMQPKLAI